MRTEERLRRQAVKRRRHRSINEKSLSYRLTTLKFVRIIEPTKRTGTNIMLSTICWLIAIAALCNAARLKYNEVKQAKKMRELVERATVIRMRKEKGLPYDDLH